MKLSLYIRNQNPINTHKIELRKKCVLLVFSYSRLEIKEPTWGLLSTRINLSLNDLPKEKTSTMAYQKIFEEVVEKKYKGWNHIYTDGSKGEIGVGVAATTGYLTKSASLTKFSSPSSGYNIGNKKKKLRFIIRLKKLSTSASKANSH